MALDQVPNRPITPTLLTSTTSMRRLVVTTTLASLVVVNGLLVVLGEQLLTPEHLVVFGIMPQQTGLLHRTLIEVLGVVA